MSEPEHIRIAVSENGVPYTGGHVVKQDAVVLTCVWGHAPAFAAAQLPAIVARSLLRAIVAEAKHATIFEISLKSCQQIR
jgi:hypothetical protein